MNNPDKDILQDIRDRVIRVEVKLDSLEELKKSMKEVRSVADEAQRLAEQSKLDIRRIESNLTWVWRGLGGAFITALVGALLWALQNQITL